METTAAVTQSNRLVRAPFTRHPGESVIQRVRLLLLTARLGGGGAQHVIALLGKKLSQEKYEIHLGLVAADEADQTTLPPCIKVHPLGARRVRNGAVPLLRLVWRLRPQVILSGAAEVNFLALMLRPLFPPGTSILVRQNGTVSSALTYGGVPLYTRWGYRLLYPHANRVICQSRAMADDLTRTLKLDGERITVLPNPVDLEQIRAAMQAPSARMGLGPHLLAVGRLSHEKGFDLLLNALAIIRKRHPGADLIIAGEGRDESALKALCRTLFLESAVSFVGYVVPVYAFFPGATLFVHSSRYEGMPNSLLEAAAAGLPLVATPASEGIVDLLRGQPGAWLAPEITTESLAATLLTALETLEPGKRYRRSFFPSFDDASALQDACSLECDTPASDSQTSR
jgi:glycosyltransferase involved in cell wall biosynthesis